jgi:SAM-dependent methyltransferase
MSETSACPADQPGIPAPLRLARFFAAAWIGQGLAALVNVGAIDELGRGPRTAGELAEGTGCDAEMLARFLRAGCAARVFAEPEPGRFALTDTGHFLRSDVPGSVYDLVRLSSVEEFQRTWAHAAHTLRTGKPAFDAVHGRSLSEYLAANAELAALFHRAMNSSAAAQTVLAGYDFAAARHVVDVGGGEGGLLAAVLAAHPHLTGTVFDLLEVVGGAADRVFAPVGMAECDRVRGGSFVDEVPSGGDVYLLSRVLHNWDDDAARRILRTVRAVMKPDAHLLIVGCVPSPEDRTPFIPALDLVASTLLGGRQRTIEQYQRLIEEADLRLYRFVHHPDAESVLDLVVR